MTLIKRLRSHVTALAAVLAVAAMACSAGGGEGKSPIEARITAASGGELRSADGSFELIVPPGAVAEDMTVSASVIATAEIPGTEGVGFRLEPDGLQFLVPAKVSLKIPADSQGSDGKSPVFDLLSLGSDGTIIGLENVSNEFNVADGEQVISADLSHFSSLYRSKGQLAVRLEQIEPVERGFGEVFTVEATVATDNADGPHSVTWEMEALGNIRLDDAFFALDFDDLEFSVATNRADLVVFDSAKARSAREFELDPSFAANVFANFTCTGVGSAFYTFSTVATPKLGLEPGIAPRTVRIALTGRVTCIGAAEARATSRAGVDETIIAGGDPGIFFTPTPTLPTPTASPLATSTPAAGEEILRLITIASSGTGAEGTAGTFSSLEIPVTGGGNVYFHAFLDNGVNGIWKFEEDELIGGVLELPVITVSPSENGNFVFIAGQQTTVNAQGAVVFIGRIKRDDDFTDGIFIINPDGSVSEIVLEGQDAPGVAGDTRFTQFNTVQFSDTGKVLFQAPTGQNTFWLWDGGSPRRVISEGDALPGLLADWRDTGSSRMRAAGFNDAGDVLLFLRDYRHTQPNGQEVTGGGLWMLRPSGNTLVAQNGMTAPDGSTFVRINDPSMNQSGAVAFFATTLKGTGSSEVNNRAIWKTGPSGRLVKVAEPGVTLSNGVELLDVNSPIMMKDGRVAFVGVAFDDTNSLVNYAVVESNGRLEALAQTDALPGASGPVSAVPLAILGMSVNGSGRIAFWLGIGDQVWMQSPGGFLHRVIAIGDSIEVPTVSGPVSRTVQFVQLLGGVSTGTGAATGFSDAGHLAFKVTFTDGSQAVMLATFDEAPIAQ